MNRMTVKSVDKCIDLLFAFTYGEPELGISELSEKLGLYKSNVHRLVKTLENRGLIEQNPGNQKYRLGLELFHLGSIVSSQFELRRVALPIMRTLSTSTGETITLNIVSNNLRICIEKVESSDEVRNFVQIGIQTPLYLGSSGKVLLAYLDEKDIQAIIGSLDLKNVSGVHLNPDYMYKEIEKVRKKGYAYSRGERNIGVAAVAAPIRECSGKVIAGISTSGPQTRFTEERVKDIIRFTVDAAQEISCLMGWRDR